MFLINRIIVTEFNSFKIEISARFISKKSSTIYLFKNKMSFKLKCFPIGTFVWIIIFSLLTV